MSWETPKTDWLSTDSTTPDDWNRIESNILYLYNNVCN